MSQIASGNSQGKSPLMSLMGMLQAGQGAYNTISGTGDMGTQDTPPLGAAMGANAGTSAGNDSDAMSRRTEAANQHPDAVIARGFAALNDPDNGLSYEDKMAAGEPIIHAMVTQKTGYKGFGGYQPQNNSQGNIQSGQLGSNGGGTSAIGSIASLAALA